MTAFREIDIAAMEEAAKYLKLGPITVEEKDDDGPTIVSVDGFQITIEDGEREDRSLSGNRMVPCTDYAVYAARVYPATFWEPEDVDYQEIAREDSPLNAIGTIAKVIAEQQIADVLQGAYYNHYAREGEEYCELRD